MFLRIQVILAFQHLERLADLLYPALILLKIITYKIIYASEDQVI